MRSRLLCGSRGTRPRRSVTGMVWRSALRSGLRGRQSATGLRFAELLALQWGDVDWHGRFIQVQRSLPRGKLSTPKESSVPVGRYVATIADGAACLASKAQRHLAQAGRDTTRVGLSVG